MKNYTVEIYRDYGIDYNVYGRNEYTVHYCGDDVTFNSLEDAKSFIDEISE